LQRLGTISSSSFGEKDAHVTRTRGEAVEGLCGELFNAVNRLMGHEQVLLILIPFEVLR
jgi:hypothetical protein